MTDYERPPCSSSAQHSYDWAHAAGRAAACVWLTACVCTCHCTAMPSAQVLWDLKPRPNSPDWLVAETAQIRKGLLTLRQNLVLVRDPENPDALYPRWAESFVDAAVQLGALLPSCCCDCCTYTSNVCMCACVRACACVRVLLAALCAFVSSAPAATVWAPCPACCPGTHLPAWVRLPACRQVCADEQQQLQGPARCRLEGGTGAAA